MARRKHRPSDPAEAARRAYESRRNPAAWGTNDEALRLPQNADVHATPETRTTTRRVQRFDCFATLKLTDAQVTAVRRYQEDLATLHRCDGGGQRTEHVDGKGAAELMSARFIDASNRLDDVRDRLSPWQMNLLEKLSLPTHVAGQQINWHDVVRRETGMVDRDAQASAVKRAAEALSVAYTAIDNRQRRAA